MTTERKWPSREPSNEAVFGGWAPEPHPQKDKTCILDVPKEMLDKARGFDQNNWPHVSDSPWRQETYGYYGAKPYWD